MTQYRAEIARFEKDFNLKATKKQITKLSELFNENRGAFDAQFELLRSELRENLSKIDKFSRTVQNLESDMKLRDDALRKVPSNTA